MRGITGFLLVKSDLSMELKLELIQTQMAQKQMLRADVSGKPLSRRVREWKALSIRKAVTRNDILLSMLLIGASELWLFC